MSYHCSSCFRQEKTWLFRTFLRTIKQQIPFAVNNFAVAVAAFIIVTDGRRHRHYHHHSRRQLFVIIVVSFFSFKLEFYVDHSI